MSTHIEVLESLKQAAKDPMAAAREGKTRVVVQVGHCSQAVGAKQVADMLKILESNDAYLVVAGCDGACFLAPQVLVVHPDSAQKTSVRGEDQDRVGTVGSVTDRTGPQRRFTRVTEQDNWLADITAYVADPTVATRGWETPEHRHFLHDQHRVATDLSGEIDATDIDDYIANGGFEGLARALDMSPEAVIDQVEASGLKGRGGAYFPAAIKWRAARGNEGRPKYLVVNCEEGEPGVFKDRHLMEGVPFRLLEGALIAAYAAGLDEAYFYINAEADLSAQRMQTAIDLAEDLGLLGKNILGSEFSVRFEVRRGAGGYVCGDETTLLNTMEGYRREPRLKDPLPVKAGLRAKPTVINNAETISLVPFVMARGAEAFATTGTEQDRGTKLVCLSGSVRRPGLAEVPMGTSLRQIVYDIGGGPRAGHELAALAVGGPSSGVFPLSMIDTAIKSGPLHEAGVMLGAGGVIALDDRVPPLEAVGKLAAYNADESCGKCTPCREGTPRQVQALARLTSGKGSPADLDELRYLSRVINAASLCGLGQMAGNPIISALHFFGDDLAAKAGVK